MTQKTAIILFVALVIGVGYWYNTQPKQNAPVNVAPVQSPTLIPTPKATPIATAVYTCSGDKTIKASFFKGENKPVQPGEPPIPTGSAIVVLDDGRTLNLAQTISADGGRYANSDESFVFWVKGDGAMVLENNVEKNYIGCVVK